MTKKVKITEEGQLCRRCGQPVVKRIPGNKHKSGQKYYFRAYLYCNGCDTMYLLEKEKILIKEKYV